MNKGGGHVSCGQSTVKSSDVYVREGAALAGDVPNAAEAGAGGRREVSSARLRPPPTCTAPTALQHDPNESD